MWWGPVCLYQKLRVRLSVECSQVPCILHLLPRVHFEFRTKSLWLRQFVGRHAIQSWFQTVAKFIYLGCITFSVLYTYKILPPRSPFSPCSILWLCRVANMTENISFPCVFTVFSTVIPWFWSKLHLQALRCSWCFGSLSNCTSQAFQMVNSHWDACSLESYSFTLGLTKRCGYNVDGGRNRNFTVTHSLFQCCRLVLKPFIGSYSQKSCELIHSAERKLSQTGYAGLC